MLSGERKSEIRRKRKTAMELRINHQSLQCWFLNGWWWERQHVPFRSHKSKTPVILSQHDQWWEGMGITSQPQLEGQKYLILGNILSWPQWIKYLCHSQVTDLEFQSQIWSRRLPHIMPWTQTKVETGHVFRTATFTNSNTHHHYLGTGHHPSLSLSEPPLAAIQHSI